MIVLKISNASELISSKLGNFVEILTPDEIDDSIVEDLVAKKMVENLIAEGIKGEITIVKGLDIEEENVCIKEGFKIRNKKIL